MREELNFELKRQFVHAIAGIVLASVLFFAGQVSLVYFCIFLIVLIGIGIPVVQKNPRSRLAGIVSAFERQKVTPFTGAFFFIMGALAAALLYPASIALYAILVLCIADAVAPIAGVAAGKHKLPWNKGKSYEGSLGFLIAAIAILLFAEAPLAAFAIAVIVTAVESLPKLDDNVTIPIAAGALMLVI
jgi:dolichol kinase